MKLAIGMPWYAGPDDNTVKVNFDFMAYLGALRERTVWRDKLGVEEFEKVIGRLPSLGEGRCAGADPESPEEWSRLGVLELALIDRSRLSLVGKAREMIVEDARDWGADWLVWWDADMLFENGAFLRLWRHQKPVVGALAFTAREPVHPVLYRMRSHEENGQVVIDGSDIMLDYPRDSLVQHEALAFGAGFVLYNMEVFRELPQPWFNSTGCGEDWFFCHRCERYGIPRCVDTAVKTAHKIHAPQWATEESYWASREHQRDKYVDFLGPSITVVKDGKVQS